MLDKNACKRAWHHRNATRINAARRERYVRTPKIQAQESEWYQRNKQRVIQRSRKWAKENPQRRKEIALNWEKRHAGQCNAYNSKWKREHPEVGRASVATRRARLAQSGGKFSGQEWLDLKRKHKHLCLCCGKRKLLQADHIIPVIKGGTSNISNIQPLCKTCNLKKRTIIIDYR